MGHLKHEGTSHRSRDLLKIFVKMRANWSAQNFRQAGVTAFGPGAFFLFCFQKTWHTSSLICIAGVGESGVVSGGVNGCVEKCSGRVWVFFQTCSRTHLDRLPVFDTPQCWGMVSSWLSLSDLSTLIRSHRKKTGP